MTFVSLRLLTENVCVKSTFTVIYQVGRERLMGRDKKSKNIFFETKYLRSDVKCEYGVNL